MSPRRRAPLPWLALLTIWIVWGSTYLAIRVVVHDMPAFAAACARFFVAGAVMAVVAALVERRRPTRSQLRDYGLIGVLFLGTGNGLVMWAERSIPSGIAALIVATVPLWIMLLDGLRPGGQPWTLRVWLGTLLGLLGVGFVARPQAGVEAGHWPGVVALLVASLSWSIGALYSQALAEKLPVFTASAIELLVGSLALAFEALVAGEPLAPFASAPAGAWVALAYLIVFGSLIGFTAFAYCLNHLPAGTVGTYAYVNPVVAVVLGALLLHEQLSPGLLAGASLILAAVVLTTRRPQRRAPDLAPPAPPQPGPAASGPAGRAWALRPPPARRAD